MYLVARLVDDCQPTKLLPAAARVERASAAHNWLAGTALPAHVRALLTKLVDATGGEPAQLSAPLAAVVAAIDGYLDAPSRAELEALSRAIEQ
jgi:hypothetical protein